MTEQGLIIKDSLDTALKILDALESPNEAGAHLSEALLLLLDLGVKIDATGAFSEDIQAGRSAVASQDTAAGRQAVINMLSKLV